MYRKTRSADQKTPLADRKPAVPIEKSDPISVPAGGFWYRRAFFWAGGGRFSLARPGKSLSAGAQPQRRRPA
jgi:hypothetical protein